MQRILRSPLPDVEIPLVPLSTWVLDKAARFADKIALVRCHSYIVPRGIL